MKKRHLKPSNLKHQFLIATPSLHDSNFYQSVVFLHEYSDEGAMGLIINKPLHVTLGRVLSHLDIEVKDQATENCAVFMGGPVGQEHGFVMHNQGASKDIIISSSKDTLCMIANGEGPKDFQVILGYAGWSKGQLEAELIRNDWLIAPFDIDILFNTPVEQRWKTAAKKLLGINIEHMTDQIGHA